jgi:hypothetical protein
MNSLRCSNCSFLNFAAANACKRCNAPLDAPAEAEENNFFGGHAAAGWQPGYQTASDYPQPNYAPQYFPTPVAPLPRASKNGGTNTVLFALLGVAVVIAAGIGVLWKFSNKPVSANAKANVGWQEYKAQDGSFTVQMPGKPSESVQNQSTPAGDYRMHLAMAAYKHNGAFITAYADYPSNYSNVPAQSLLDLASQGAMSRSSATLLSKKNISLDGYAGLELEMLPPGSTPGRMVTRIYWVAPRIYMLFGVGAKSAETDAALTKYFDSFKLRK